MGITEVLFPVIGGLGLFLYGMKIMSDGLQHVAGDRMRRILATVSANRVIACITGTVVTAVIQSSSATTVMVVGFVNAGLLTFSQAVGVVLGANIGTTVTAQLIAFKITKYALPAIAIGVAMRLFARRRRNQEIGLALLGFGLLFFGMATMTNGVAPLKDSQLVLDFFTRFQAENLSGIFLCVLVGTVVTMLLQSSSATVGLTMALATQGLVNFPGAVALILGDNIGTTITAELASIGADTPSHQTARAHTMFNVIGVSYMVLIFPIFIKVVEWVTANLLGMGPADFSVGGEQPNIARYIAVSHTMFNVINAFIFLLLFNQLLKVARWLTPSHKPAKDPDLATPRYLDKSFLEIPGVAMEQARQEIRRMGGIADDMMKGVVASLPERDLKKMDQWRYKEAAIDQLQRAIIDYLVRISQSEISFEESKAISSQMRMANNIERIGDSVENLAELIEEMIESDLYMSNEGIEDYRLIANEVAEFFNFILENIEDASEDIMEKADPMEEAINLMKEELRLKYLIRLRTGVCTIDPGIIFTDMLNNFEKIGDYCYNIAQAIAGVK